MAPSKTTDQKPLQELKVLLQTATALISQLETFVHSIAQNDTPSSPSDIPPPPPPSNADTVDALSLAHDSASLIRAHATKLSLLIINEPFTPSAINKVLRELVAGPVPGIASAVQVCDPDKYTRLARQELASACYSVLKGLRSLLGLIPLSGEALSEERKNGGNGDKGSIAATGVVWSACDTIIGFKKLGIAGILMRKVEEYRETMKDVLEELKEWSEETDDDNDSGYDADSIDDEEDMSTQDLVDDLMNPAHIPRDDPNRIRERLDSCLTRLRTTTLLYTAVMKRRIKVLPSIPVATDSSVIKRLNEVMPILQRLPNKFGDVAYAFYELDPNAIDTVVDSSFSDATAASEMLKKPWKGEKDEFTEWAEKFQINIKKPE
ncbi:hypothetical protein F4778DRAFT_664000 [Xylariomycetidae sp. FL2044]|nr:hypothetical protein F4778DRAFT_663984 [Xylariomycetidae sp. FL2044]KAH9883413.1 hypothetical protein F4778DRAFT_664000 [Xylariomycetidae sp. FL2044]